MSTEEGLAAWLTAEWGEPVTLDNVTVSSAGARRLNVLFDARSDSRHARLAATILPNIEIQILDIATEAEIRLIAEHGGVPVPHVHSVCLDPAYVGGPFFVSDCIEGETIPRRVLRLVTQSGTGPRLAAQIGTAIGRLHAIDAAVAPVSLPRPVAGRPVAHALDLLRTAMEGLLQPEPAFSYGLRWLERNAPDEPARCVLVHSDIRNGNIIVGAEGLRAILDWEGSRVGDPMEDVAWPCTRMWRFGEDAKTVGGFAGLEPYRSGYEASGGVWEAERFRWWRVLGTLRWGLGLAGQAGAHLDGRARSIVMAGSGRRLAELAYDLLLLVRP
jgi:aminoglycoside phosphotransferase (APT) family kinase protein